MAKSSASTGAPNFPDGTPQGQDCYEINGFRICFPIGSTGPTIPIPPISIGPIHGRELRRAIERFRKAGQSRKAYMHGEIDRFCEQSLMSRSEAKDVHALIDHVADFDKGDSKALGPIRAIHEQLVDDDASPVAIMISGIAFDSTGQPTAQAGTGTADVAGGIAGGAVGAGVGGAAGSVPGAAAGAVLGGLFGGLAASFAHHVDNHD